MSKCSPTKHSFVHVEISTFYGYVGGQLSQFQQPRVFKIYCTKCGEIRLLEGGSK